MTTFFLKKTQIFITQTLTNHKRQLHEYSQEKNLTPSPSTKDANGAAVANSLHVRQATKTSWAA